MNTQDIIKLDKEYFMNTYGDRIPVAFDFGEGSTLCDNTGKAYIDFLGGIAVNILGYNHPALTDAVIKQAGKLMHCSNLFYIEPQARLAELLVKNSCGDRVFVCNSGAEANEAAFKLARIFFSRKGMNKYEIISTKNSFHGRTLAAVAATGQEKYQRPFDPMPAGFSNIPYNDLDAAARAVTDITCAIMVEVIQGEGGVIEGLDEYIKGLRKLCDEKGVLLIIDEVQTGIGRTGKLFGYEHYGIEPDIFTLAKGLGGGIPIGALVAKEHVAKAFEPGNHGTTFGGNPLSCSAGVAVLNTLLDSNLVDECMQKGNYFKDHLNKLKDKFPFVTDVRGKGLMLGLELDPSIPGKDIVKTALDKGFIINCAGNNTLRFVPPLIISTDEIDMLITSLDEIFRDLHISK